MWFLKPSSNTNLRYLRGARASASSFCLSAEFQFSVTHKEKAPVDGVVTADTARAGVIYELRVWVQEKPNLPQCSLKFVRNRILFGSGNHQTRCTAYS